MKSAPMQAVCLPIVRPDHELCASTAPDAALVGVSPHCVWCRITTVGLLRAILGAAREQRQLLCLALAENEWLSTEIGRLETDLHKQGLAADGLESDLEQRLHAVTVKADALQAALEDRQRLGQARGGWSEAQMDAIRACMIRTRFTVLDVLVALATLYPEQVVVLESAYRSARASHDFQFPDQAADLLVALVTTYRDQLAAGRPEGEAKRVFGHNKFAATESRISKRAEQARTFIYRGASVVMLKHLKLGVGEKASTGLRIHFHWDAELQIVVIGYCGEHLDFV